MRRIINWLTREKKEELEKTRLEMENVLLQASSALGDAETRHKKEMESLKQEIRDENAKRWEEYQTAFQGIKEQVRIAVMELKAEEQKIEGIEVRFENISLRIPQLERELEKHIESLIGKKEELGEIDRKIDSLRARQEKLAKMDFIDSMEAMREQLRQINENQSK